MKNKTPGRSAAVGWLLLLAGLLVLAGCAGGAGDQAESETDPGSTESTPPDQAEVEEPDADDADADADDDGAEADQGDSDEQAESSLAPLPRRTVEIYFPSQADDGLVSEFREIFATATAGDQIKQILADLISGPASKKAYRALPAGTRLRQAYVLDDGVAWLDFSSELTEGIGGGSMAELLTVYSIVNSVVANVSDVRRVGILVNGQPVETLNGHMHMLNPLRPNFSLILGSITVSGPRGGDVELLARTGAARVDAH